MLNERVEESLDKETKDDLVQLLCSRDVGRSETRRRWGEQHKDDVVWREPHQSKADQREMYASVFVSL